MSREVYQVTSKIINQLYGKDNPDKGALANLRRTISVTDKGAEKIWPLIFQAADNVYKDEKSREQIFSSTDVPNEFEIAVYTALHCYAMFQQGNDDLVFGQIAGNNEKNQSEENGVSLFTALKQIKDSDEKVKTALDRRVTALLATTNTASAVNSINHLVNILKGKKLVKKVDFAQLATDLYNFQTNPQRAREVALKWGRDYYWNVYQLSNDKD